MEWKNIVRVLPAKLVELENMERVGREKLTGCPDAGVYVFFKGRSPIYVGRSNRMHDRILEHGRSSGTHYSASLAFKLARANKRRWKGKKRKELTADPEFVGEFGKQKTRVASFKVKWVEIREQPLQAVFEVYASLKLDVKLNDWGTH